MKKLNLIFLTALIFFSIAYLLEKKDTKFYKSASETAIDYGFRLTKKIDSLELIINILSTDTISISEWKFDGDTMQYIGSDSIVTLPHYYKLVVISNENTGNTSWNIVYKFENDTILK